MYHDDLKRSMNNVMKLEFQHSDIITNIDALRWLFLDVSKSRTFKLHRKNVWMTEPQMILTYNLVRQFMRFQDN